MFVKTTDRIRRNARIYEHHIAGMTQAELAAREGLSIRQIARILREEEQLRAEHSDRPTAWERLEGLLYQLGSTAEQAATLAITASHPFVRIAAIKLKVAAYRAQMDLLWKAGRLPRGLGPLAPGVLADLHYELNLLLDGDHGLSPDAITDVLRCVEAWADRYATKARA